ncbi:MAG: hypothetical protein JXX28_09605 [Deltaproteobacteria bacterium]|nr:hypothetical protein [Deltaproteobacteria bacterium]
MDDAGVYLPVREIVGLDDGDGPWNIDSSWIVCADPGSIDLARKVAASNLLLDNAPGMPDSWEGIDGFPEDVPVYGTSNYRCSPYRARKAIFIRDWTKLGLMENNYLSLFPELSPWQRRLEHDPQSYAITYSESRQQIAILGGSPQGVQHGVVGFLRDVNHRIDWVWGGAIIPFLTWEDPKSVLDYPELEMRVSSYPEMSSTDEQGVIDPWINGVIWNRYTHVNNDTQLFSILETTAGYSDTFDHMATEFTARSVRFIPRLYSAQAIFTTPGPDITGMLSELYSDDPSFEDPYSEDLLEGPDPDVTGTYVNPYRAAAAPPSRGIHLTEGMRVPVAEGGLTTPDAVVPVEREYLNLWRGQPCGFLPEGSMTDLAAQVVGDGEIVDCRTGPDEIVLCADASCPKVNGVPSQYLWININAGGSYVSDDSPYGLPPDVTLPSGDPLEDPHDFEPGHVYLLAIRYQLQLGEDSSFEDIQTHGASVDYVAGPDVRDVRRGTDLQFLPPTTGDAAWATYVFKVPEEEILPLTDANNLHADQDHFLRIRSANASNISSALHIHDLQLFDLGNTLAYPLATAFDPVALEGSASCAGLIPDGSASGDPGCTMDLVASPTGAAPVDRTYPERLLARAADGTSLSTPVLDVPTTANATALSAVDGYYHTVLTPGLWPRATEDANTHYWKEAPYPYELRQYGANFERDDYWAYHPSEGYRYQDGFLGAQLRYLHQTRRDYPDFFETSLFDNANAYTEAEGFNRSRGFLDTPQSNMDRISWVHCRMQQELVAMGYDTTPPDAYTPGGSTGYDLADTACADGDSAACQCDTTVQSSTLLYSDMFTRLHNGIKSYNAPFGGGPRWSRGVQDPFEEEDLRYFNTDSDAVPTFGLWWYRDDPEMITELFTDLSDWGFPIMFWMGSSSADLYDDEYHRSRGAQRELARLAAGRPWLTKGAATYYNSAWVGENAKDPMTAEDERSWERAVADCMWNPRWRQLRLYEMKEGDFEDNDCEDNPGLTCTAYPYYGKATQTLFYGYPGRTGTPESVRLAAGSSVRLDPTELWTPAHGATRTVMVRGFARRAPSATLRKGLLVVEVNGTARPIPVLSSEFSPFELTFSVLSTAPEAEISVSALGNDLLMDAFSLYEELPSFGYEAEEDGSTRPAFPSDIDERTQGTGWRYCDDLDFVQGLPKVTVAP